MSYPRPKTMSEAGKRDVILAVDHTPENLDVVSGVLGGESVINDMIALKIAEKAPPDLIPLDVIMSGMRSYEVCEQHILRLLIERKCPHARAFIIAANPDSWSLLYKIIINGTGKGRLEIH